MDIYVNGVLSGTSPVMVDSATIVTNRQFNYFGRRYDYFNDANVDIANVYLDEIKIYNISLTQEQIMLDKNTVTGIPSGICSVQG
jgi:hypothetical protein